MLAPRLQSTGGSGQAPRIEERRLLQTFSRLKARSKARQKTGWVRSRLARPPHSRANRDGLIGVRPLGLIGG